ncbi:MAG: NADH:flavin oxidoreductase [Thermodesulfobacteriota bacterium]
MDELFAEADLGNIRLNNRFIRSSTWEGMAGEDGRVTEGLIDLYKELVRGGVGLILTGHAYVSKRGQANAGQLGIYDDQLVPDLRKMIEAVHGEGGRIGVQLAHAGSQRSFDSGLTPWAPSEVEERATGNIPRAMTVDDIEFVVKEFAEAARRGVEAGFDAVEIHSAHGFLLAQFLSPYSNRRQDRYGGSIEKRSRIVFEVFDAVKRTVGRVVPVTIKINCADFDQVGLSFEDSEWVCSNLVERGIDLIELSGGVAAAQKLSPVRTGINNPEKEAYFRDLLEKMSPAVQSRTALVGGLRSLEVVKDIYLKGAARYFSFSRPLILEPGLINRWASGDTAPARCISCNKCFQGASEGRLRCLASEKDFAKAEREG